MDWRNATSAMVLVPILALPAPRALRAGAEAGSPTVAAQDGVSHHPARPCRSRRSRVRRSTIVVSDTVALASEYLRDRSVGVSSNHHARAAWDNFYQSCDVLIRRYARKLGIRGPDADDCAQEVWTDLLRTLPTFTHDPSRGRFSSWLYAVVRGKASDMVRRKMRRPAVPLSQALVADLADTDSDPALLFDAKLNRESVQTALSQLNAISSGTSFRVIYLRCIQGLPVREVADGLGLSSEQVWVREHRMKRKLRELLSPTRGPQSLRPNATPVLY